MDAKDRCGQNPQNAKDNVTIISIYFYIFISIYFYIFIFIYFFIHFPELADAGLSFMTSSPAKLEYGRVNVTFQAGSTV